MRRISYKHILANTFGAFGYFFCLLQWIWLMIVFLPFILDAVKTINEVTTTRSTSPAPAISIEPNIFTIAFASICIAIIMILFIYIIFKIPFTIVNSGRRITHEPAKKLAPLIVSRTHRKVSKKERKQITARLVWTIKGLCIILPLCVTYLVSNPHPALSYQIISTVGLLTAALTMLTFGTQLTLAFIFSIPRDDLW